MDYGYRKVKQWEYKPKKQFASGLGRLLSPKAASCSKMDLMLHYMSYQLHSTLNIPANSRAISAAPTESLFLTERGCHMLGRDLFLWQ